MRCGGGLSMRVTLGHVKFTTALYVGLYFIHINDILPGNVSTGFLTGFSNKTNNKHEGRWREWLL
jgi:hypothetical protein